MKTEQLTKEIKSAVEWLKKEDCGCSTIKLDDTLAVCVGWAGGYAANDKSVIHSETEPDWCICAGIKVWTSDSMRTDFDWISSPYYENGNVWNDACSISPNEDYEALAKFFLDEYESLSEFNIERDGKINGHKNMWVCPQCLMAIESHEGKQFTKIHYIDEDDKTPCEWCGETFSDILYELV